MGFSHEIWAMVCFTFSCIYTPSLPLSALLNYSKLKSTVCKARLNNAGQQKTSFAHLRPGKALVAAKGS